MNLILLTALALAQGGDLAKRMEKLEKENAELRSRVVVMELERKADPKLYVPQPLSPAKPPIKEKRRIPSPRIDMAGYVAAQGGSGGVWAAGTPFTWGPPIGGCRGRRER